MEKLNSRKKNLTLFAVIIVVGLGIGGFFYFKSDKSGTSINEVGFSPTFYNSKIEEVSNLDEVSQEANFIFNKREVTGLTDQNDNIYQTSFFITDSRGDKIFKFYETSDLTYEMAYPYLNDEILILTEFGLQENRAVNLDGEVDQEIFIPPIGFGPDFVTSQDGEMVGYIENQSQVNIGSELSFDFSYLLKVKNIETSETEEFEPGDIKHGEVEYSQYLPLGFSEDNQFFYIFASQIGMDVSYQNANGLYAINIGTGGIEELYFSSIEEMEEKDLIVLLGVFPEQGFALVNRGPQISEGGKTILRTQLQKLDLKTKEYDDIFTDNNHDLVGSGGKILSPDGQNLVLLNDAYYDRGLSLYDLNGDSKKKLTERGEFLAWLSDSVTIIYRIYTSSETEEEGLNQGIELHSLNIETGEDYKIYSQDSLDEGTGLNEIGDTFYSFIGSI